MNCIFSPTFSGTVSYYGYGITVGYFYNPTRSVTGWFVGYAPGAGVSLAQYDNNYNLIWSNP